MAKPKKCKVCGHKYPPRNTLQQACSPKCAIKLAETKREREFKAETRELKKKLKTRNEWISEAQKEFNKYIRIRDKYEPCISCGRQEHEITEHFMAGKWDCGHFLSRGAFPELRFNELNAHKQCKSCNGGSGNYAKKNRTVSKEYEERLINKIGQDLVDYLKGPHPIRKYTIEEIQEIKAYYKQAVKELQEASDERCAGL